VPESLAFNMGTAIVVGFTIMLIIDESFKILQTNYALEAGETEHRFQSRQLKDFTQEKKGLLNGSPNSSDEDKNLAAAAAA